MGLFDIFKKKKPKTVMDALMELPGVSEAKALNDAMAAVNAEHGCTSDQIPGGTGEFGLCVTNPIPTNTVMGSTLYLGGLRAPDGTRIKYERLGSWKADNIDKPIDCYQIFHQNGTEISKIYISPYQAVNSKLSPKGLHQVSPLL